MPPPTRCTFSVRPTQMPIGVWLAARRVSLTNASLPDKNTTTDQWHEVWFDNSTTLATKYKWAIDQGMNGVGMWTPGATGFDTDSTRSLWSSLPRKTDDRTPAAVACTVRDGVVFADECGDGFRARDAAGQPDHTEVIQAALNATAHTVVLRNLSAATPWTARPLFLYNNDRFYTTPCSRF